MHNLKKASAMKTIYFITIFFSLTLAYAENFETLENYSNKYPKFDKKAVEKKAKAELKKKGFALVKLREEIDVTSKRRKRFKGKYYGRTSSGGISIGFNKIAWIDVPENKKYLFSEDHLEKKQKEFLDSFIALKRKEYDAKRTTAINKYKNKLLASPRNIKTSVGQILCNVSIKNNDEWGATIIHTDGSKKIKYQMLPASERKKIKSGFIVTTLQKVKYPNIQMHSKTPVSITFYTENGQKITKRFKDLSDDIKKHFKYSIEKENAYWKKKEKIALANAKRAFWSKVDKLVTRDSIKNAKFKTFQATDHGVLCVFGKWSSYYKSTMYDGNVFFLYGANNDIVANNEKYTATLYYAGTYKYTTVKGVENTIRSYAVDKKLARRAIVIKLGLQEPGTKPPPKTAYTPDPKKTSPASNVPSIKGFGSGFIITNNGYILTNQHVVKGAKKIQVKTSEKKVFDAKLIDVDKNNDLAIIKIEGKFHPVSFSKDRRAALGETAFTVGFPRPGLQGFAPKVTKGVISGLKGMNDDARQYQIDAAIQPGNSGGPLADKSGHIIGVIVSKLNEAYLLSRNGDMAQNVNYAIKKSYTYALLDSHPKIADMIVEKDDKEIPFEEAVEKVNKSTVLVIIY